MKEYGMNMLYSPSISVIMPVHNEELYVHEAIESILTQTLSDFEFIIIDDGSSDKTWDIVQSYKDKRIIAIKNKINIGNYPSRNEGMKLARGKYIAVMDGDDVAMPDRLEKQYIYLEHNQDVIALGTLYALSSKEQKKNIPTCDEDIRFSLLKGLDLLHPSLMIRTKVFRSIGGYDEKYKYASDYNLFCQLSLWGKIENLPEILMIYRTHDGQISKQKTAEQNKYANTIRRQYQVDFINKYTSGLQSVASLAEVGIPEIGLSICYYTFAQHSNKKKYKELADKTIDVIYKIATDKLPLCIENGLCGLGCGLHYLIRNRFLDGDVDDVLEDIDHKVQMTIKEEGHNSNYAEDIALYLSYRITNATNPDSQRIQPLKTAYAMLAHAELILENHE